MRDLRRYPITLDEEINAVEKELESYRKCLDGEPVNIGDIHALALLGAINRLKRLQFAAT